jgi:hypothetical protein
VRHGIADHVWSIEELLTAVADMQQAQISN